MCRPFQISSINCRKSKISVEWYNVQEHAARSRRNSRIRESAKLRGSVDLDKVLKRGYI